MTATSSAEVQAPIPVSVITGFLGSGKTTVLRHLLGQPEMSDAAVIINEFGEIGLDHQLVESSDDNIVLMSSGCLCCTIRNDLVDTLRDLHQRRQRGEVPRFRRVLVETTGLADPAPILHTLMEEPALSSVYRLDGVVTTVDAVFGAGQLDEHVESVKQAAVADRLVVTKTDLVGEAEVRRLVERLRQFNPAAPIVTAVDGRVSPDVLFDAALHDPRAKAAEVRAWLNADAYAGPGAHHDQHDHHQHAGGDVNRHDDRIRAYCLVFDEPLNWRYFSPNLASLVSRHAEKLLRVKGILNVAGEPLPVVVHGVQHQFQRMRLAAWPDEDRRSKLVLITRDLSREFVAGWLRTDAISGG